MTLMIDTVEVHVPVQAIFCKKTSLTGYEIIGDVTDYDLSAHSRHVRKVEDGTNVPFELYHSYESLPTSHTGIGFKFMHRTNKCLPHVILNCSIAKILQGHNVFGSLDMIAGVLEMLGVFRDTYPEFSGYLDFKKAEISRFDVTLPVQTQSLNTAEKIRDYFRFVDWGRYRNLSVSNIKEHYNTLYFGSEKSKVGGFKLYCKGVELNKVVKDLQKKSKQGCITSNYQLQNIFTPEVIDYSNKSVRIEATVKKRMIKDFNLPTNLWQFLTHQLNDQTIYKELFDHKTKDFFQALEGMAMTHTDDIEVFDLLHEKLTTITPTGKVSTTKAKHAYNFYKRLKDDGFYEVKRTSDVRTFQRNVKALCDAGFSRAYLQNLTKNQDTPILRILNLDFNAPNPQSFQPPVTQYFNEFKQYFNAA
ncbi:phage/plasmid replication protein, II/X family [Psychrobacter sp. Cmf 22.2]|uniref:phage/plasmid replication protein, II/X family n=1 Tax=Psychrobacter sp. Cmf 22.2 TaxID=1926478 RepID=UPI0015BA7EF6|nr:phage/plasmid replication protein, II/X family [Psychrobacter sp. Cmf 22.2]